MRVRSPHPFYLCAEQGQRLCLYHEAEGTPRGLVLYVHPFAEEMNKSRRMAATQSRMLAAGGYGVLQIDLYGCGDSDGELRDATWALWKSDVEAGLRWLGERGDAPRYLWGLRSGALLALDAARSSPGAIAGYLLWQPIVSGEAYLGQFLRLRMAAGLTGSAAKASTQEVRDALDSGSSVEIAGYDLTPALARAFAGLRLEALAPRSGSVCWLELVAGESAARPRGYRRVVDAWTARGVEVDLREVIGTPFWNSVEIVDSPALLAATMDTFAAVPA